jgi:hypothetical protein
MKAPLTLRRPENWQDFESLCKILWGEIWHCPEIQKNGRLGQEQSGVDIFGIPLGEDAYYGIQCKGKSEYKENTSPQITEQEIEKEIEKAKLFSPPLKKFYIATTALSDAKIQAFVRKKNIEHKKNSLFEVHIFFWETIVDLINENKRTSEYYLKSQNYKSNHDVSVTFSDGQTTIVCKPKFKQTFTRYRQRKIDVVPNSLQKFLDSHRKMMELMPKPATTFKSNKSYSQIKIKIHNSGIDPLEEYKLFLKFEGKIVELENDINSGVFLMAIPRNYTPTTFLSLDSLTGKIVPRKPILVGEDTFASEVIYIKTTPKTEDAEIVIKWKLISKDFKDEGELTISVRPEIIKEYKDIIIEDEKEVKTIEGEIEDYFEK